MLEDHMKTAQEKMRKAIAASKDEFATIRTGRASPNLLERIEVDYYGTKTPLMQIAGVSVPEARLLVISPYDRSALSAIEKAILGSDLGLTPSNDGSVIRLSFPPLTEERRKELIKQVRERAEEGRVAIRNVRRHSKDEMERIAKEGHVSEDDVKRTEKDLQKITDHFIGEIDELVSHKEKELLEI
ncbi:MAG TPA: ribosome recycling factor [Actinomycetota bacterium]|nr:ribosome recycling factor [Actinomycetota bacterium]